MSLTINGVQIVFPRVLAQVLSSAGVFASSSEDKLDYDQLVNQDPQEAIPVLENWIRKHPGDALAFYFLGEKKGNLKDPDAHKYAYDNFQKAFSLEPNKPFFSEMYSVKMLVAECRISSNSLPALKTLKNKLPVSPNAGLLSQAVAVSTDMLIAARENPRSRVQVANQLEPSVLNIQKSLEDGGNNPPLVYKDLVYKTLAGFYSCSGLPNASEKVKALKAKSPAPSGDAGVKKISNESLTEFVKFLMTGISQCNNDPLKEKDFLNNQALVEFNKSNAVAPTQVQVMAQRLKLANYYLPTAEKFLAQGNQAEAKELAMTSYNLMVVYKAAIEEDSKKAPGQVKFYPVEDYAECCLLQGWANEIVGKVTNDPNWANVSKQWYTYGLQFVGGREMLKSKLTSRLNNLPK